MKALRGHQIKWSVTVTRKYHPPQNIIVFGRSQVEALQSAVSSVREVWGIWDAKSFGIPERK